MVNTYRVGVSVLRYRGGWGQWAWAVHRIAGLGVLLFLAIHIADIFIAAFGAGLFNELLFLYKGPVARIGEVFLAFGLLYHALNGLRLTAADFIPRLASLQTAKRLLYLQLILFVALFAPAGYFMMWSLPQDYPTFYHNTVIAAGTTLALLLFPAVVAIAATVLPPALFPSADVSAGNYDDAMMKLVRRARPAPRRGFEYNVWLFMRLSGIALIVLALFHMFYLHFIISVEDITFNTLVARWNSPVLLESLFWRGYDLALLAFAFTHGINGAKMVLDDYIHARGWKNMLVLGLVALWLVLMAMGAGIILFFNSQPV